MALQRSRMVNGVLKGLLPRVLLIVLVLAIPMILIAGESDGQILPSMDIIVNPSVYNMETYPEGDYQETVKATIDNSAISATIRVRVYTEVPGYQVEPEYHMVNIAPMSSVTVSFEITALRHTNPQRIVNTVTAEITHINGVPVENVSEAEAGFFVLCPTSEYSNIVNGIAVEDNLAFIADDSNGLCVIDVSDPEHPSHAGRLSNERKSIMVNVFLSGDLAITTHLAEGIQIIDITERTNPQPISWFGGVGCAYDVWYAPPLAYVVNIDGLIIVNLTDPLNPAIEGQIETPGHAKDITVVDEFAYIADGAEGLVIVNITNASDPRIEEQIDTDGYASSLSIQDSHVFIADHNNGLVIIDLNGEDNATILANHSLEGSTHDVAVVGNTVHLSNDVLGLVTMDITNVSDPVFLDSHPTPGTATGIALGGSYAYLADGLRGLTIIDTEDRVSLDLVSSIFTHDPSPDFAITASHAMIPDWKSGLMVLDIGNIDNISRTSSLNTSGSANSIAFHEPYAYIADWDNGLVIVDSGDPSDLIIKGHWETQNYVTAAVSKNEFVYLTDGPGGLVILDVSNPDSPVLAGSIDTLGIALDVSLDSNVAYLMTTHGLEIFDVSDPNDPKPMGLLKLDRDCYDIQFIDNRIMIAMGEYGFTVINVIDPDEPLIVANITDHSTYGLASDEAYLFVSDWSLLKDPILIYGIYGSEMPGLYDHNVGEKGQYGDDLRNIMSMEISGNMIFFMDKDRQNLRILELTEVQDGIPPPVATINSVDPNPVNVGEKVTFDGSGTGTFPIVAFIWISSIDGEIHNGSDATFNIATLSKGQHTISLLVVDSRDTWSDPVTIKLSVGGSSEDDDTSFIPGFSIISTLLVLFVLIPIVRSKRWQYPQH